MNILMFLHFFTVSVIIVLGVTAANELADTNISGAEDVSATNSSDVVNKEDLLVSTIDKKLIEDIAVAADAESVSQFIKEFHQQFEEEQQAALITRDSPGSFMLESTTAMNNATANSTVNATESVEEVSNTTSNLISCITGKDLGVQPVELVNSTRLLSLLITESNITNRRSSADCVALLFYACYCPFSSLAAPHFNALPRAFPDIKMAAVDAMKHHSFNTQYGIVGVPTVMLFHNGRPAAKFNDSEYTLEMFARFITKYTGMEPQHKLYVTSADFGGPVPSVPTKETDYCLILSWTFILVCAVYFFSKSAWWSWIVETVQNTWREAEAQHEHGD